MSKYDTLWKYVQSNRRQSFKLTFEEIENVAGIPIDHSFLKYKKEFIEYCYEVGTQNLQIEDVALYRKRLFLVYQINGGTAK
ncbi:MAG: hypothetical protein HFG29_00060 [Eubacterium sp.]|nr:hypothetical protein [Eubacterium sp.]